ncbi:hypothetical protein LQG66_17175 [Bradyrhizobium ontarionense]|uniref:Uncharacterized protein n=1 Tax=Bradyrhizobium ontarionense TaxID=2898149 RepID=A0ABY3RKD6_9BRAD|nr:hypothetical protein [Bradyrhizobium sp. A19]UFZ07921.1 hypothetical protein LQG66_17175 [Bradyrhizobium sp. A19]
MATKAAAIVVVLLAMAMNCFARSNERMTYSVIAIEYIGESDGLVRSVLISNSEAGAEWYRRMVMRPFDAKQADPHVISISLLNDLIAAIDTFQSARQTHVVSPKGAAVQVSIITPERNSPLFHNSTEALSLLEGVQKTFSKDESLSGDIAYFQKRILQYRRW